MRCIRLAVSWSWPLVAVLGPLLVSGCSDESKKTGTMVQETDEMKAQTDEMRDMYKNMNIKRY
ncbi:MAG: hypothetical protein IRY99_27185 [Isosphaeraceae bacterium]|nr:hypothetical protein [Isosphaeraceae bacterium]